MKLPLRTLVLGDFSGGTSEDRGVILEERKTRTLDGTNRVDDLMKDMGIGLKVAVPNTINPDADDVEVSMPVTGMKSFSPDEVAQHIPQVKALLLFKSLLTEMQSNIDNRREFRKLIQDLCANPEAMQKTLAELKRYENYKLPTPQSNGGDKPEGQE
jgi:type VI secretion system protein ImpB